MRTTTDKLRQVLAWAGVLPLILAGTGCTWIRHHQADMHVVRGERLLLEDDLEVALAEFQAAAELYPQLAVAHSNLGVIYQRMGEYERAIECLATAIRYNPFSFVDSLNLARLYQFTKRLHDAVEVYLHACDLEPDDFDAQLNLGVCYQQMGEIEQAAERFHNAIEIDPAQPYAFVNLGVAYDTQGKYYEAIHAYKDALERDNSQPLVLVNLAHTYMKQERLKIARASLMTALKLDGQLAPAHEALGYCLFRMQDYDLAERAYKDAAANDPKLPNTYAGLGSICAIRFLKDRSRTDLRSRALEYWHRSLELDADQPKIRRLVAKYKPANRDPQTELLSDLPPQ